MNEIDHEEAQRLGIQGTSMDDPSGHALAEAAYAAGAVEPAASLSNMDVTIEVVMRGTREHAEEIAAALALELIARSDVVTAVYAVSDRDEWGRGSHVPGSFDADGHLRDVGG